MKSGKQTFVIIAIIVVSFGVALAWNSWGKQKKAKENTKTEQQVTVSNLTNGDPKTYDTTLKKEYGNASAKAIEINPQYKIAEIETTIGSSLQPEAVNTRYIFSADNDAKNNWVFTVSLSSQNYIRASIPKDDYAGIIKPFDLKSWKFSYLSALQYAEKNGGLAWREKNTLSQIVITFKNDEKDTPIWSVEYQGSGSLVIKIDPSTGEKIN